jgi:3-deoxy-D-manno-octulosonic-acid transferase
MLKPILNKVDLFCMQTERDAMRLCRLGVSADKVQVTGNMKFDADFKKAGVSCENISSRLKQKLRVDPQDKVLIAASTHPEEEEIVLNVYKKLIVEVDSLRLLIVPRHPERSSEVKSLVSKFGFSPVKISALDVQAPGIAQAGVVFILDTVGELVDYYTIADVVFVGGSFVRKGGHNILEPAAVDKPVIFGPHMFNFRDIVELFLQNKSAVLVHDEEEFAAQVKYLFDNPQESQELSRRAKELILKNRGATQKNLELIKKIHA